jgi:hypothetical protein
MTDKAQIYAIILAAFSGIVCIVSWVGWSCTDMKHYSWDDDDTTLRNRQVKKVTLRIGIVSFLLCLAFTLASV